MSRHQYDPLDESCADLAPIKVTIDAETGLATLEGVHYDILRSILDEARLHQYDHPFVPKVVDPDYALADVAKANALESQAWHWVMEDVTEACSTAMSNAIRPDYPARLSVLTTRMGRKIYAETAWVERTAAEQEASKPEPSPAAKALSELRSKINGLIETAIVTAG